MTSKGDFYAPPTEQQYQAGGVAYKEQQDYEVLEAGLVPNINAGGRSGAAELEKQLRLGEQKRERRVDVSNSRGPARSTVAGCVRVRSAVFSFLLSLSRHLGGRGFGMESLATPAL